MPEAFSFSGVTGNIIFDQPSLTALRERGPWTFSPLELQGLEHDAQGALAGQVYTAQQSKSTPVEEEVGENPH